MNFFQANKFTILLFLTIIISTFFNLFIAVLFISIFLLINGLYEGRKGITTKEYMKSNSIFLILIIQLIFIRNFPNNYFINIVFYCIYAELIIRKRFKKSLFL